MKKLLIFIILILMPVLVQATAIIAVPVTEKANLERLPAHWDVIKINNGEMWLIASDSEQELLAQNGVTWRVQVADLRALMDQNISARDDLGAYTTYDELSAELTTLAQSYPDIMHLTSLGQSWQGRDIWAVKISDNPTVQEDEPEVLYISNHHSRELITVEVVMYFLRYVLENYGSDPDVNTIVNERQVWIIPMLNPDGHHVVQNAHEGDSWGWWRKNTRDNNANGQFDTAFDGVDLNRNYDFHFGEPQGSSGDPASNVYHGPFAFSEPETQVMQDLCGAHDFVLALSYHSFGDDYIYPWSYADSYSPDHDLFQAIAQVMRSANGYEYGNSWEILQYLMSGEACDWMYDEHGILAFTPEVGPDEYVFYPPESEIPTLCQQNLYPNLVVALMADNPYRVFPPASIEIAPIEETGTPFTLTWTVNDAPGSYSADHFSVQQLSHPTSETETAEDDISQWTLDGFSRSDFRAYAGTYSFYSGYGDNVDRHLQHAYPIVASVETPLTFQAWYDIQFGFDYAYVEISTDGVNFTSLPGNITTDADPYGHNLGYGITGNSNGWVTAEFPLDAYNGQLVWIRFRYVTDGLTSLSGIFLDNIYPITTYSDVSILADDVPDEAYNVTVSETGTFAYRVRGHSDFGQDGPWSAPVSVQVTTLAVEDQPNVAAQMALVAYPNPFSTETRISFTLPQASTAAVRIYNVAGQLVQTVLPSQQLTAGSYDLRWDGTNQQGQAVAAGLYILKLTADNNQLNRRVVLLR